MLETVESGIAINADGTDGLRWRGGDISPRGRADADRDTSELPQYGQDRLESGFISNAFSYRNLGHTPAAKLSFDSHVRPRLSDLNAKRLSRHTTFNAPEERV